MYIAKWKLTLVWLLPEVILSQKLHFHDGFESALCITVTNAQPAPGNTGPPPAVKPRAAPASAAAISAPPSSAIYILLCRNWKCYKNGDLRMNYLFVYLFHRTTAYTLNICFIISWSVLKVISSNRCIFQYSYVPIQSVMAHNRCHRLDPALPIYIVRHARNKQTVISELNLLNNLALILWWKLQVTNYMRALCSEI
jgi:hypothetical protein